MRNFLIGVVATLVVLAGGAYWYFASGHAPVAVAAAPMPFETMMAGLAKHAVINREMPRSAPFAADEATEMAAVPLYRTHCAVCHGLPGQPSAYADTMFPSATQMFSGKGVSDDPAGETYWKITNGIRLSGMPTFSGDLSDTARWQLSLLLANSDKLSPQVMQLLAAPLPKQ